MIDLQSNIFNFQDIQQRISWIVRLVIEEVHRDGKITSVKREMVLEFSGIQVHAEIYIYIYMNTASRAPRNVDEPNMF